MGEYNKLDHEIKPIYNENSRVLILGTFPSVKSREAGFFYHHPQNRFWKVLAALLEREVPTSIEEKRKMLLDNGIAVWDVISSCEIVGSSDSSIKNVVPSDIQSILDTADIQQIFANGGKAKQLYEKYTYAKTGAKIIGLPSTSPANAAFSLDRLLEHWRQIKNYL